MRRETTPPVGIALVLALSACGGAAPSVRPASDAPALSYEAALDAALSTMRVSICPAGSPLPDALVAMHDEADGHVRDVSLMQGDARLRSLEGPRFDLAGAPQGACVRYDVDLTTCSAPQGAASCGRSGRDLFAPTSTWLLAPETRRLADRYTLRFVLPPGIRVTPIGADAGRDPEHVILDDRAFAFVTYLAFVHEAPRAIAVPGACIDVVTLDGALDASFDARAHWLETAATASARVTGHAPFERLTAIVVPTIDVPSMPVLFGVAGRGMRPSVTLLVSEHATEDLLVADWTAVHELAHFLTAYLEGEDEWLSEGLATYYQEVLRARQGVVPPERAWAALLDGIARGRAEASTGTLREAARTMHETHAYARVYWSGAALALLADLAYRQGETSLDQAVARAWEHRAEHASAAELLGWLDGEPDGTFARLAAAALDAEGFPDPSEALAWLGVTLVDGVVSLRDDAPGARVRSALMNEGAPPASNPSTCERP